MVVQLIAVLAADYDEELLPREQAEAVSTALDHLFRLWRLVEQEELLLEPIQDGTFQAFVKR